MSRLMLPTRYKAKIAQSLSYPVGAADLSTALAGVPQFCIMTLWFGPASHLTSLRPGHAPRYAIFAACYRHMSVTQFSANYMVERRDYGPKWTLSVYEVPRACRHRVKTLLSTEGLPRVREWLVKMATITGREGWCEFVITFDEAQQTFQYETGDHVGPERE